MAPKLFLTTVSIAYLGILCNTSNILKVQSKVFFDTTAYPSRPFSSVTLFVLDSSVKTEIRTGSGTVYDDKIVEYVGDAAYSFIDSTGVPKTQNVKSYQLDSSQILKLDKFLIHQPCSGDWVLDKNCVVTYKNVFVFYDGKKKPIAQFHLCFHCEKTTFRPYAEYMCNFDNKVDFKALKKFVDAIVNK